MTEFNIEKLSFSIGEVAEHLGVNTSVIRFWEKEFKELKPRKNNVGTRRFRREDIEILIRIKTLLYEKKYTIQGAKKVISGKIEPEDTETYSFPADSLKEIRDDLQKIYDKL